MERGLYIAASGMMSEMVRQDQIANDLANSSTPGYKADRSTQRSFGDLLLQNASSGRPVGTLGLGVAIDRVVTDMSPAPVRITDEPLDFAVEGEGFFAIQSPQGVRFTRGGQFQASDTGRLVTSLGAPVLGPGGAPITVRPDGTVPATAVGVFAVPNARKLGEGLMEGTAAGQATGQARSGALEGSGADPARSMVDMIASFRAFESGQRVLTTIDSTLQQAAGRVGSISG